MVFELASAQAGRGDDVEVWTVGEERTLQVADRFVIRYFRGSARFGSSAIAEALDREDHRIEVLHAHNTFLSLNILAARVAAKGVRLFYHAHGALDPQLLRGWTFKAWKKRAYVALLERRNYDRATGLFGLTQIECEQIAATGTTAPIFEASNGIHLQPPATSAECASFRLRNSVAPGQPMILFVGRLTHKKGLHYLLDAMAVVNARRHDAVLVICGGREQDPEYVAALDLQIKRLGLGASIRWGGFVDEKEKRAAFSTCSIFAHPSYSEGMALAVLEAMGSGVPTVVTPGCYMGKAVEAGAVALSKQSPEALAATLLRLLEDPAVAKRYGEEGHLYVKKFHSWSYIADRLAGIYTGRTDVRPFQRT